MHDKSFIKLKSMRYRKTICYLKSKNLQHVNELMKKIDKKNMKIARQANEAMITKV